MKRKLPKDGLLRTESAAAHKITAAKRDRIAEKLAAIMRGMYPHVAILAGCSVIRIECAQVSTRIYAQVMMEKYGVHEIHTAYCKGADFPNRVIGVVR